MEKSTKILGLIDKEVAVKLGIGVALAAVVGGIAYYLAVEEDGQQGNISKQNGGPTQNTASQFTLNTSDLAHNASNTQKQVNFSTNKDNYNLGQSIQLKNESVLTQLGRIIQDEQQMYSIKTLVIINELIEDSCIDVYGEMVYSFRTERRKVRVNNPMKYAQIIEQEVIETDQMIMETIHKILESTGGDFDVYRNSIEYWSARDQRFAMMNMMWLEKMKISIKTTRDRSKITVEIAKEMMKFQVEQYPQIQVESTDPELDILIKKATIQDMVVEKFGFEEEDLVLLPHLAQDPEFIRLTQGLQMAIQMDQMRAFQGMGMGY